MTFEAGKEYKARDGRRARVYAVECNGTWPIHGAVLCGNVWKAVSWTKDGESALNALCEDDLMPPEPEKITLWSIVYDSTSRARRVSGGYLTKEEAFNAAQSGGTQPVAIIPITFHRGEGLE